MSNVAAAAGGGDEPKRPPQGTVPIPKSKRGLKGFLSEVGREMKKVSWPTKPETNRLTGVVLAVCILVVVILTLMSVVFDTLVRLLTRGSF